MSGCGKESAVESFYMIRVRKDENGSLKASRLDELEKILEGDERAKIEHVIRPIYAVVAFLYDAGLVAELERSGYELLPQKNVKMIE